MATQPGDIVVCHGEGLVSWMIRSMERIRYRKGSAPHWNHAALLVAPIPYVKPYGDGEQDWMIIEAGAHGVQHALLSELGEYNILDSKLDRRGRRLAVEFAETALGSRYGFLTIASIVINLLLPVVWQVTRPGTFICSGLVAHALEHGGHIFPLKWEADEVMPADLACLFSPANNE